MFLKELFDQTYPFKFKKYSDGMTASFKNDNNKITVSFNGYHIPDTGWSYEISFGTKKHGLSLTGQGDEFKTFGTIISIITEFISTGTKNPILFFFTADAKNRNSLYSKISKLILKKHPKFVEISAKDLPSKFKDWWNQLEFEDSDNQQIIIKKDYLRV